MASEDTPHISMQTIAEACGVSRMTVSLALRGRPGVIEEKRKRIVSKAKELGYHYDSDLSKLTTYLAQRNRKQKDLGEIPFVILRLPDKKNYSSHTPWQRLLEAPAKKYGYRIERYEIDNTPEDRKRYERIWRSRGVQGIVLSIRERATQAPKLTWKNFSWIALGRNLRNPTLHRVDFDQRKAVHQCATRLHQLGYERIGFLIPRGFDKNVDFVSSGAAIGYQSCLPASRRVPIMADDRIVHPNPGDEILEKWIKQHQIDAIVDVHFKYERLCGLGLKFPRDLGYASSQLIPDNPHNLAGIIPAAEEIGNYTIPALLTQMLQGDTGIPSKPSLTLITGEWHAGKTVRKRSKLVPLPPELR